MSERVHASRIAAFKNAGKGTQDLRRKRVETSVALRRAARDEQLQKRRACSPDEEEVPVEQEQLPTPEEIVKELRSEDGQTLLRGARAARRVLSRQHDPPIQEMIDAGVVKPLVKALDRDDLAEVQFEAAWALTNIASGTRKHTMSVVDAGAVPRLVSLLCLGGAVGEQAAWALGNIAGDGAQTRDLVLSHGALPALLPMLGKDRAPQSQTATAVWTLSNFCRNKDPMVEMDAVAPALPFVADLLTVDNNDILTDACWCLSYLTDGTNERIEAVQTTPSLLPRLVPLLSHAAACVQTPALRSIGNMVTGTDAQTERCLEAGCLPHLNNLLSSGKSSLVKEAAWCVSNILAGSQVQIQQVIDAGVLPHLVKVLETGDTKCGKEASWAVTNLCLGGSGPQLGALLAAGALRPFCSLLSSPDPKHVLVVLEGISHLLQAAEKFGEVEQLCVKLEEEGALDKLEALQEHENQQVYTKTLTILDKYFADASEEKNAPEQTDSEYKFGVADSNIGNF